LAGARCANTAQRLPIQGAARPNARDRYGDPPGDEAVCGCVAKLAEVRVPLSPRGAHESKTWCASDGSRKASLDSRCRRTDGAAQIIGAVRPMGNVTGWSLSRGSLLLQ